MPYVPFGGLGGLGGMTPAQANPAPADQQNQFQRFLSGPNFGNAITALGMSLMGSPSNAPLSGFSQALAQTQAQTMAEQDRAMVVQKAEEEKARRTELAKYAQTIAPPNLQGLAATDPEAFLQIWEQMKPKQPDAFTLGPGETRYLGNQIIAQGVDAGPEQIINNNIGGTDKFYDTMDAKLAEQTAASIDAGMNATSSNMRLGELENILQTAPQGTQGVMVQAAGSIGLPVQGLDDVQAAQALINQMVPGQRPPGSGTMSDADLDLFKKSLPAIINQPGGNQKIIATMRAINEYTIAQAQIAQQVANREISPAEGRAMQAQVPNPLASGQSSTTFGGNGRVRTYNPQTGRLE